MKSKVTPNSVACVLTVFHSFSLAGNCFILAISHRLKSNRDSVSGFQLYQSDPSGNYVGWQVSLSCVHLKHLSQVQATAIGSNSQTAQSILKTEYDSELSLEAAKALTLQVLKKIMDVTALSEETVEIIEMTLAGDDNPQVTTRFLSEAEIVQLANERDTRT